METFIEVLKLLFVTLLPCFATFIILFLEKKISYLNKVNYYVKQIAIGFIFACIAMSGFYLGMKFSVISDDYKLINFSIAPILASPAIASLIFGWPAGVTSGSIAFIWRVFATNITNSNDLLRFTDAFSILVTVGVCILASRFLYKKRAPVWPYGILIGLLFNSIYYLLLIPIVSFTYKNINYAFEIIRVSDWITLICYAFAISISLLIYALLNHQRINVFKRTNNPRISSALQKRLSLLFILAIIVSFGATTFASTSKSYSDAESDLMYSTQDVVNDLNELEELKYPTPYVGDVTSIVANSRIRSYGFSLVVAAKDIILQPDPNSKNEGETKFTVNDVVAVPNRYGAHAPTKLYFDKDPNKTCETFLNTEESFADQSGQMITCKASGYFEKSIYNPYLKSNFTHLIHIIKTNPIGSHGHQFYVVSFLSRYEIEEAIILSIRMSVYLEILVFSMFYILIYLFLRKKVVNNIRQVNTSLSEITSGKLNTKVEVREYSEFNSLSNDINATVDTLKGYIADAKKRIEVELQYAKNIQMNAIPLTFPTDESFDLYAKLVTAKEVGGDFYDFFMPDDKHLMFMIADVSGKGIPAAMFMMRAKALIKALAATNEIPLDHVVSNVNYELNEDNESGMFVTAWFGNLNIETGELQYVNAGHTRPIIKTKDSYKYLEMKTNCVLGVSPEINYQIETLKLEPGDQILIYTDGVTEATNSNKELYGEKRLLSFLDKNKYTSSFNAINELEKELMDFQKDVEQADDITILSLIYKAYKK